MNWDKERKLIVKRRMRNNYILAAVMAIVLFGAAITLKVFTYKECRTVHDSVLYCLVK